MVSLPSASMRSTKVVINCIRSSRTRMKDDDICIREVLQKWTQVLQLLHSDKPPLPVIATVVCASVSRGRRSRRF